MSIWPYSHSQRQLASLAQAIYLGPSGPVDASFKNYDSIFKKRREQLICDAFKRKRVRKRNIQRKRTRERKPEAFRCGENNTQQQDK